MFNGMWNEYLLSSQKENFDLIFLSHILEHIVDPKKFIEECASVCNKYIFIDVPCFDVKFKDEPYGMFSDEHVNIFTIQGLWNLMDSVGFSPIDFKLDFELTDECMPAAWPAISTLWQKGSGKHFLNTVYDSNDLLDKYLNASEKLLSEVEEKIQVIPNNEKLALWGVGNHLHRLLGSTSLTNKNIVRMYDSDKHKHGHKVLGIAVTSFNEEDVIRNEVESVLITTYNAQQVIAKFLEERNLKCKVYTLYDI